MNKYANVNSSIKALIQQVIASIPKTTVLVLKVSLHILVKNHLNPFVVYLLPLCRFDLTRAGFGHMGKSNGVLGQESAL